MSKQQPEQSKPKALKDIPKLSTAIRKRLTDAVDSKISPVPDFSKSNIIPINFGSSSLSAIAQDILVRGGVIKRGDEAAQTRPVLDDLDIYFNQRKDESDNLPAEQRTKLASFVGGSILSSLEAASDIVAEHSGPGIYAAKFQLLTEYIGLIVREEAFDHDQELALPEAGPIVQTR